MSFPFTPTPGAITTTITLEEQIAHDRRRALERVNARDRIYQQDSGPGIFPERMGATIRAEIPAPNLATALFIGGPLDGRRDVPVIGGSRQYVHRTGDFSEEHHYLLGNYGRQPIYTHSSLSLEDAMARLLDDYDVKAEPPAPKEVMAPAVVAKFKELLDSIYDRGNDAYYELSMTPHEVHALRVLADETRAALKEAEGMSAPVV